MAIRYSCDICNVEMTDKTFACNMEVAEVKDVYDITSKNLNPRPQLMKQQIQICKTCYENNIVKLLKL